MTSGPRSTGTNRRNIGWLWILMLPAVFPLLATAAAAQETPPGLVAYWTLDEGSGIIAADSVGSYDGTVVGATWGSGVVGNALRFDGIDDLVSTSFNPDSVIGDGNSYTETFWLNQGPDTGKQGVVVASGDASRRFYFINEGNYQYRVGLGNQYTQTFQFPNSPVDTWTHVAIIFDSSASRITVHANGNPTPVLDHAYTGNRDLPDRDLILSEVNPIFFWPFTGMLDEVAIYDRVLTPYEIEAQYSNGLAGRGLLETGGDEIWVPNNVSFHHISDADEVFADQALPGRVELSASANNWSTWQDPVLEAPVLTLTTPYGVEWLGPEEHLVPGSEYRWEFPDLAANDYLHVEVGLDPSVEPSTFLPGFHLTRAVSNPVIEAPGGEQTVTVTVTQEEGQFDGVGLFSWVVQIWGGWDYPRFDAFPTSYVPDPQLDCHMSTNYVYCIDWNPGAPRTYQVEVTFDVGLYGEWHQVEYVPTVKVQADFNCCDEVPKATSITEATEYGTWTWETGEIRFWHSQYAKRKWVDLESRVDVLNYAPVALCQDVELPVNTCEAEASIDAGSYDPDGDEITLEQDPPGPYGWWSQPVWLNVTDEHGATTSCEAWVNGSSTDADGDEWFVCHGDCDDENAAVHPGASEICDGQDNNCDGAIDEGMPDGDADGICDGIDNCEADYNPGQEDCDGDGSGDVCDLDDTDSDGLSDAQEINFAGGICPAGCPDPVDNDSDDDGLLDGLESNLDPDKNCDFCVADTDGDGVQDASDPFCNDPSLTGACAQDLADFEAYILSLPTSLFQAPGANTEKQRQQTRAHLASIISKAAKHLDKCKTANSVNELEKAWARVDGAEPPLDDMVGGSAEKALVLDTIEDFLYLFEVGVCGCASD